MLEIRTSLTLEDTPPGIPGAEHPAPADLVVNPIEYPISAGDTLAIEIYELRQRLVPFQTQAVVSTTGYVNLPVVGRVAAEGLTTPQFEAAITEELRRQNVLVNPEVTVNPLVLQKGTYSIFGIGVSASNNAPLRAGTFPIRRPDLRVLEAINLVGGLNEFVTEVYVFRNDEPLAAAPTATPEPADGGESEDAAVAPGTGAAVEPTEDSDVMSSIAASEEDLIDAVVADDGDAPTDSESATAAAESLEPAPTDPFIYVDGEFVQNPAYAVPATDAESSSIPSSLDSVMPAVNWARVAGETSYRVIRIPADLLRSGDPDVNIVVRAGDVVRIVSGEIGVYYVMGQVNRVGVFAFNAEPITLKAAIAAAGGLSGLAWPDRCTVYRRIGQREQMIQVDLDRIFAGKDPDFFIRRGDIVNVGTHPFAPFLQRIRAWTLPSPVNNVGYSFTYARNYADIDSYSARLNPANEPDRFPALFP
jgi:protein involved in polysaccharide export with SLBB domain